MKIVVCVKHVPDAQADRGFAADTTTDREAVDGLLSELDEYAVEQALRLREAGDDIEVVVLTVGPDEARNALKKALQLGADAAVLVSDEAVHGSDAVGTSLVLARALQHPAWTSCWPAWRPRTAAWACVPAMLAERLGLPAGHLRLRGHASGAGSVRIRRDGDAASETVEASLPAVVSVTDQIGEARLPSFKGIMAAKKKPVDRADARRHRRGPGRRRPGRRLGQGRRGHGPPAQAGRDRRRGRGGRGRAARRVPRRARSSSEER